MRESEPALRLISKFLPGLILSDPLKCLKADNPELVPLSEQVRAQLPDDDVYLVELYSTTVADLLVTSDGGFRNRLEALTPSW